MRLIPFLLFAAALAAPASAAFAADNAKALEICKSNGKSLVTQLDRIQKDDSPYLANEVSRVEGTLRMFEDRCISGPPADAVKGVAGYADVTALHAQAKSTFAALEKRVAAKEKAQQEESKRRHEEYLRKRAEEEQKRAAELAAQRKKEDDARAAEETRAQAERRKDLEKRTTAACTQGGKLSQICYDFFTTPEGKAAERGEDGGYTRSCLESVAGTSPDVSSAEHLLSVKASSKYAAECLRMMDVAKGGAEWRKRQETFDKLLEFGTDLDATVRKSFKAKCGVEASVDDPMGLHLRLAKKNPSKAVFLSKKDPEGNHVTVHCSGSVVKKYASGGSSTAYPKTEAEIEAEAKLRRCAQEKALVLPTSCPQGKISFERGDSTCIRAAEAECKRR
jgi:hypothetical protein